jgi:hypothetical protein
LLSRTQDFNVPVRVLTVVCVFAVAVSMASLLIGAWDARGERDAALQRYVDTQALLALPPVDLDALEAERDEAAATLSGAEASLEPPSIDPASDEATAFLVNGAAAAGLTVTGVNRAPAGELKDELLTYDVEGIRITVDGRMNQVVSFLYDMQEVEPGFIPALESLTINDDGVAHADIVFNTHTEVVVPTPVVPVEVPE